METATVTRRTQTGEDWGGTPTCDTVTLDPVLVDVAPGAFKDVDGDNRDGVEVTYTLYGPDDWDVREDDTITVRGETMNIVGKPAVWPVERGVGGTVVEVNYVNG